MSRLFKLLLIFCLWTPAALAAANPAPSGVVERLNSGLLSVMRDADSIGYAGRVARFGELLSETYNLAAMAKASVGAAWEKLSQDDRARLTDAFSRMTYATYASRFSGYSGERFEVLGTEPTVRDLVVVHSRLVRANGETVALDYTAKQYDGQWRIVDVNIDGKYSELARLRAEFSSVLQREGLDGLLQKIEARIARSASEG
jgi:phospholipid transport system substrate-binding protein